MAFRQRAGDELREFIRKHIADRRSFAFETTLRDLTFDQIRSARHNGFHTHMIFVAAGDEEEHLERVAERGARGGHIASAALIREIHRRGMALLGRAIVGSQAGYLDILSVFHNRRTPVAEAPAPTLVLEMDRGIATFAGDHPPAWFLKAIRGTSIDELWR